MQAKREQVRDSRGRPVPNLYKRGDQFIVGYKQNGVQRMKNLSARTLTEAKREKDSFLASLREGRIAIRSGLTFASAFSDWQDSRSISPRTRKHERHLADRHLADLQRRRIQDVTATMLAKRLRELGASYSPWTCHAVYRIIHGTFALALLRGTIARSPVDGLAAYERPKQRNQREVARLDPAALDRLVLAGRSLRWRVALGLAAWAGLRLGEVRGLRWDDVDLASGVLHVRRSLLPDGTVVATKTEAGVRDIPLLPSLRRLLVELQLESPHSLARDFVISTGNAKPVQERNLRRALAAAKEHLGLDVGEKRLSWHALRHSCASLLATELDLPVTTLAAIIGHADAAITYRTYARDARDTEAIVADVLDRARKAGIGS